MLFRQLHIFRSLPLICRVCATGLGVNYRCDKLRAPFLRPTIVSKCRHSKNNSSPRQTLFLRRISDKKRTRPGDLSVQGRATAQVPPSRPQGLPCQALLANPTNHAATHHPTHPPTKQPPTILCTHPPSSHPPSHPPIAISTKLDFKPINNYSIFPRAVFHYQLDDVLSLVDRHRLHAGVRLCL